MTDSPNVELVRSIYTAWERGNFGGSDWADPSIEFVLADGPEPGRWVGLASMADAWRNRLSAAQDLRAKSDEFRELDDERVLALWQNTGRGKVSGIELGQTRGGANFFSLRDGKSQGSSSIGTATVPSPTSG